MQVYKSKFWPQGALECTKSYSELWWYVHNSNIEQIKLIQRWCTFTSRNYVENRVFLKISMDGNAQKSYKNWSYTFLVSRELKSIKKCFANYIGRPHTTFPHQRHRFFEFFSKNRRHGHRKNPKNLGKWKSRSECFAGL